MAKTKKSSNKKLGSKIDKKLLKDVIVFLFLVLAFYTVMYVAAYSSGSKECAIGQEVEAGCQADVAFSSIFLLPSIILAGALLMGLKRISQIKHHVNQQAKKVRK